MTQLKTDLSEQGLIHSIRVDVVDRLLQGSFILALLGVPASLSRAAQTGWLTLYTVHLALGLLAVSLYLVRRKLSLTIKLAAVISLFTSVGIGGLIQLGLLGVGMWWLVVTSLLIGILFSPMKGMIVAAATMAVVLVVGWCFVNGVLQVAVDADTYLTSWSSWITLVIATSIMPFFVFQSIASLQATMHELFEEVSTQRDAIHHLAIHDQLTGLLTAPALTDRLNGALALARRNETRVGLMFLDLDGFKLVNDTYGHDVGDQLLKELAQRYRSAVRAEDVVARVGGDEFIFLLTQTGSELQVASTARRLLRASLEPMLHEGEDITVGASIGISLFPDHGHDADTLRKLADKAMYDAKKSGKNSFRLATAAADMPKQPPH